MYTGAALALYKITTSKQYSAEQQLYLSGLQTMRSNRWWLPALLAASAAAVHAEEGKQDFAQAAVVVAAAAAVVGAVAAPEGVPGLYHLQVGTRANL